MSRDFVIRLETSYNRKTKLIAELHCTKTMFTRSFLFKLETSLAQLAHHRLTGRPAYFLAEGTIIINVEVVLQWHMLDNYRN